MIEGLVLALKTGVLDIYGAYDGVFGLVDNNEWRRSRGVEEWVIMTLKCVGVSGSRLGTWKMVWIQVVLGRRSVKCEAEG